jgi:HK97 gp10 family phage protein
MKTLNSLSDLARALEQNAKQMQAALAGALKTSAIAVADAAKDKLDGKDKPQDWPELSDAAKAEHVRKGYDENAPLLASGALRDSIQYRSTEKSFEVGSDSQIAVYQELGTATIPPRPFLAPALHNKIPSILETVGKAVEKALAREK